MEKVTVQVKEVEGLVLPSYESENASGMDVRVNFSGYTDEQLKARLTGKSVLTTSNDKKAVLLRAGDRYLFPTGLRVAIPVGYEIQVRPRSGMALKHGVTVLNTPGTIDADYRGEIGIVAINLSKSGTVIEDGERIAQLVLVPVTKANWSKVKELPETKRGEGGFNSTGKK
jgi:dUTP pyrophosphatase